jgi:SAM-dependent methyltransferase
MTENIKATVRDHYAEAARQAAQGDSACCCSDTKGGEPISLNLYSDSELAVLPEKARLASLGCGNPTALAELEEGEVVLDLGSGGGIDVLLSAQRVGPTGKAYGLDMTDEMLDLARENQRKAGVENVEFLKGEMEDIPLPDASVDVIISNCVINLSSDKARVIEEAFRVLKPGGRFAVSDVVALGDLPAEVRQNAALWSSCLGGALEQGDYRTKLAAAGFEEIDLESTRNFEIPGVASFMSAFVRARKPA